MNASERAHLAAMGLQPPSNEAHAPLLARRRDIRERADALRVRTLITTPAVYRRGRRGMTIKEKGRFRLGRRQHKLMQRCQNAEAKAYREMVGKFVHNAPNPIRKPRCHLKWLPDFLRKGTLPLLERKDLAGVAEETARYAIEQAEKHAALLDKWEWGYFTLRSRRQHEGYARLARRAAIH
ncbi:hypothetical protein FOQG_12084 [Fusarium oxysporum f. sp. raphani 54005]|uniref:Uncharacterized protein n=3 Tax=Fusarium oxysporum TaxID=5507 RepID=X0BPI4_FUSOX|nr:hypothetical protein FOVG_11547 [Fusarium oxysporum f. sp. pisi HDV247]EXK83751.1 hypothetical protein FOQG_12084 [Fusarium oxysporum f. sp. raphani 54005]KAG7422726.1 hypothetical protein Forpi1262_v015883 [Fusarium oxysporum f. sp. raphani]KAJ4032299.1 hypothetical protein NW758_011976 [Fusarium oxysporum]WKT49787.1 hypothetical protein QSH57_014734 [Fusarium oxysporum f. sp. vasinfectum]